MTTEQSNIEYITKSPKSRISRKGMERLARAETLAVLAEVQSIEALNRAIRASRAFELPASAGLPAGWRVAPSVLDHPIVRAVLDPRELAELLSWACTLAVEEDAEVSAS